VTSRGAGRNAGKLAAEIKKIAAKCFSCKKCSAGCPVAPWADLLPHRLVRLAQEGDDLRALAASRMLWLCASCLTCSARCPHGVELPRVAELVREWALAAGVKIPEPEVAAFHRAFLGSVRSRGRANEFAVIARSRLAAGSLAGLFEDLGLGWRRLRTGTRRPLGGKKPSRAARERVRRLFEKGRGGA